MKKWILIALLFTPGASHALFTGDEQFSRADLDTESRLDQEYFLALLALRPFWRPLPAAELPRAWVGTSIGSLNSEEFYVQTDAGVRGRIGEKHFWGYRLRQLEDLEQRYFYQMFEAQAQVAKPLALRVFGEPTGKKQSSDLGVGAVLSSDQSSLQLDFTAVDPFYSKKNLDERRDRQKFYNTALRAQSEWSRGSVEAGFEWDSPMEREYGDENTLFGRRASNAYARMVSGPWDLSAGWENTRRTLDPLAVGSARLQDFRLEAYRGEALWTYLWGKRQGRFGLQAMNRSSEYDSNDTVTFTETSSLRWEVDPYLGMSFPLGKITSLDVDFFHAMVWEDLQTNANPVTHDFSFQARARTALRFHFTPDVTFVASPTWDLDQLGRGNIGLTFDGGYAQLEARIP